MENQQTITAGRIKLQRRVDPPIQRCAVDYIPPAAS